MDGVLGMVEVTYPRISQPQVYSHGRYPVKKLCEGQTIRFYSRNYGTQVILHIERIHWFEKMVLVSGPEANDVAFDINEWVEIVSVEEAV